ncbi:MAG: NupC/NupG family nucleoside CNT transporter [Bacilli bacterium]
MNYLWGITGIIVIFAIAYLLSENKKAINWRTVGVGFIIQLSFAFIVLKWSFGRKVLQFCSDIVQKIIDYANEGIGFVFGALADPGAPTGFIFAFKVLCIIIFFSSLVAVLYHLRIMQLVVNVIGGGLSKLLKTTNAESLSAAGNIFLGQTEAPLLIRPYIAKLSRSELFAVMVGGLASVAGSVLAGYAALGIPIEYLLAASFMAAPAGLTLAKLLIPQTENVDTNTQLAEEDRATNLIEAAANGAGDGLKLALNVGAMLLAFISLIALLNGLMGWVGGFFGAENFTLEILLGYLFSPIAFIVGVPWDEAIIAGSFIGQKLVLNEFVAFSAFAPEINNLGEKTVTIITFALCGFANLSSIAILLGGLGSMAPTRRSEIAALGLRAIVAGTLANLLSAAIAGMFI